MSADTSTFNVVDSSGWLEYPQDTERADLFAQPIEVTPNLLVPTIALFEVHRVLSRHLAPELVNACLDVMRLARVLDLTDCRAIAAAEVAARQRLAIADAAMYSAALEHKATFWAQDVAYADLPGVRYFARPANG